MLSGMLLLTDVLEDLFQVRSSADCGFILEK